MAGEFQLGMGLFVVDDFEFEVLARNIHTFVGRGRPEPRPSRLSWNRTYWWSAEMTCLVALLAHSPFSLAAQRADEPFFAITQMHTTIVAILADVLARKLCVMLVVREELGTQRAQGVLGEGEGCIYASCAGRPLGSRGRLREA